MNQYKTIRVLSTTLLALFIGYIVLQICFYFMNLISLITFSILLAYLLIGPVDICEKILYKIKVKVPNSVKQYLDRRNHAQGKPSIPEHWHLGEHFRKSISIMFVYVCFFILLVIIATQVIPPVIKQVTGFAENLPTYVQIAENSFDHFIGFIDEQMVDLDQKFSPERLETHKVPVKATHEAQLTIGKKVEETLTIVPYKQVVPSSSSLMGYHLTSTEIKADAVNQVSKWIKNNVGNMIQNVVGFVSGTLTGFVYTLTCFVLTFYFLMDGERIIHFFNVLIPKKFLHTAKKIEHEIHIALLGFIKGQLILGVMAGIFMYPVYVSFGLKYSILLAFILTIAEIVPVIGSTLGFIPAVIVMLLHGQFIPLLFVWLIFWFMQTIKDHLIAPKIVGEMIGLHPVPVILSLWVGVQVAGFVGVLVAIPVACILNVIIGNLVLENIHETKKSTQII